MISHPVCGDCRVTQARLDRGNKLLADEAVACVSLLIARNRSNYEQMKPDKSTAIVNIMLVTWISSTVSFKERVFAYSFALTRNRSGEILTLRSFSGTRLNENIGRWSSNEFNELVFPTLSSNNIRHVDAHSPRLPVGKGKCREV